MLAPAVRLPVGASPGGIDPPAWGKTHRATSWGVSPIIRHATIPAVDESRKKVVGIMAAILAARKLAPYDAGKRVPATMTAIGDAVRWAEEILREIDRRWPSR
jgi:hypothetical protein